MQGESLERIEVVGDGIEGDRTWGVRDLGSGHVLTARREPKLLHASARLAGDGVEVDLPDGASDLGTWLERDVRLERATTDGATFEGVDPDDDESWHTWPSPDRRFVDVFPVHLLSTASLGGGDVRRFRPNVLVEAGSGWPEDAWVGRRVRIGGAVLDVTSRCPRCVMPGRSQPGLPADLELVRSLRRDRQFQLGVALSVVHPGAVQVGDAVELV